MDANKFLSRMTIPDPCSMDWDAMRGDERTRRCVSCRERVYDLTAMTSDEAAAVLHKQDGQVCARVFERADGMLVIADCQASPQPASRPWQFRIRTLMGVVAGVAATLGIGRFFVAYAEDAAALRKATAARSTRLMGRLVRMPSIRNPGPSRCTGSEQKPE
jgi:hypothetical protein